MTDILLLLATWTSRYLQWWPHASQSK